MIRDQLSYIMGGSETDILQYRSSRIPHNKIQTPTNNCQSPAQKMQPQNFILKQLTSNITPKSVLTVLDVLPAQIVLEIRSQAIDRDKEARDRGRVKGKAASHVSLKQYRIKFQTQRQFEQILAFIALYDMRKAKVSERNWRNFAARLSKIHFGEILVDKESKKVSEMGIQKLEADHYRIMPILRIDQVCQLFEQLHETRKKSKNKVFEIQLNFVPYQGNMAEIVEIIKRWIIPCQCQSQLQKLSLYSNSTLILSLQKNRQYGLSICLHRNSTDPKLCLSILQQFTKYSNFVSLQFLDWQPQNPEAVNFIFTHYHHRGKYLIKFGNYLEITELRLFINTTGMTKGEVASIFNLMKQPGHYELICHSTKEYFQEVVNIFLYKPLVYFKYFVPLAESQELQGAIEAMMEKADLLRKKIQVFMNMLKSPHKLDLNTIIKLFLSMSKTSIE